MKSIETQSFIHKKFADYYQHNAGKIESPSSLERREFAFLLLKEKMMRRHEGFKSIDDVRNALKKVVPSHVYYSTAYYEKPEEEMNNKGWLGADLFFDIDADHIQTACNKQHDTWSCVNCKENGHGVPPEKCPKCGGQKFDDRSWACEVCLDSAKEETIKLVDILNKDFGFAAQEIQVAFSGHRGYHVTVEETVVQKLDQAARREIVDYVVGVGIAPELYEQDTSLSLSSEDDGWRGRIAKRAYDLLSSADENQLMQIGLEKRVALNLVSQRERLLKSRNNKALWKMKGIGKSWKRIMQKAVENQSVKIDTVVTPDIHRLIRLNNSIHGKTGLKKVNVPIGEIEEFDPLKSALAFDEGTVELIVSEAPEFRLGDHRYGPFSNSEVVLPTAAALFLLCKGAAKLKDLN